MSGEAAALNAHILFPELVKSVLKALVDGASMTCRGSRLSNKTLAVMSHGREYYLEQVANLLCAQVNSASYPQRDGK